ncbi:hypothetical protein EJC47_11335, partial [Sphingomonas sp. TF3]|uniref:hypothetical protein n=1 Tax=Sphingomonas sp. TF3 TaxID=2495580 RepID=UPI000F876E15
MLDFHGLRGGPDGWRGSFERLVQHLAEVNRPTGATEFRPIEGAGGDGGIEAYWVFADGSETGYQAKFHERAADIDWAALDGSVETALATHPSLVRLVVAMPCDLTDVKRGRGTSAREKWNGRVRQWREAAAPRDLTFEFLSGSQIERLLTAPNAAGLREYWFSEQDLSKAWFRARFERTVVALDERYHPEDHVDVQAADLFRALRGSREWRAGFTKLATDAANAMPAPPDEAAEAAGSYSALAKAIDRLQALASPRSASSDKPFPTSEWIDAVEQGLAASLAIAGQLGEDGRPGMGSYQARRAREEVGLVQNALAALQSRLGSEYQRAEDKRYAIIEGEAGGGKSHLMAREVEVALAAGEPAIMLLGTDFIHGDEPGMQIARSLELRGMSTHTLLGALEAAAAARGTRALIAIDALNEGAGARYWRDKLAAFSTEVRRFPRVTLCVSCRDVYSDRVFTGAAREGAAQIEVEGFQTEEEQEHAAAVYMDRRGIARPASPWLPPEFINPLFLRTTCVALERRGQRLFPLGLRGAREMLRFYLNAAAATLGTDHDGTDVLEAPLVRAVTAIAAEMARLRADHIERDIAATIVEDAFRSHAAPSDVAWVDLLLLRGLLRADPPETEPLEADDPLDAQDDVLRFAFQRIQDQLIAKSLIQDQPGPGGLFEPTGVLAFLVGRWGVEYEWRGVLIALAVEFADAWGAEMVDHMPGDWLRWWDDPILQEAFVESVRWRQHASFRPRTLELLNALEWPATPFDLLIELSAVEGHPWNADVLHRNLAKRSMPDRDAFWTTRINGAPDEPRAAHRLADWGLGVGPATASDETIRLALTALGWLFTSTNAALRDRATKAATEILLRRPTAVGAFVERFADVDDVYVIERILAAVAGSCLRDPTPARLTLAAASVWHHVIAKGHLPDHVLARDHARLVLELAAERGSLPADCDLDRCRPPYGSTAPRFGLNEAKVKAECIAAGDHSIFSSTVEWGGDFGTYVVKGRARSFTSVRLTKPRPVRHSEAYQRFREELIDGDEFRVTLLSIVEMTTELMLDSDRLQSPERLWDISRTEAEATLVHQLGTRGRKRYETEARPHLEGEEGWLGVADGELGLIDQEQARLWIARRAIRLGWTKRLFPRDAGAGSETSRATRIERIGKKYQWIAYHELIARLADNYWLAPEWGPEAVKRYETPLDLPFTRTLEPTVPPRANDDAFRPTGEVPVVPRLALREVATAAMYEWVFEDGIAPERLALGLCPDMEGEDGEWLTLYRYASRNTNHIPAENHSGAPSRLNDFHFVLMVGAGTADVQDFVATARNSWTDFHHDWINWGDLTDGPYLYEAGMRSTWPETEWVTTDGFRGAEQTYLRFCREYRWEHHLDGTLPEGVTLQVPNPWLLRELGLTADPHRLGVWVDGEGRATIVSSVGDRNAHCLVRRDALEPVLAKRDVAPLWIGMGERCAWPDPSKNSGPNCRWNGILWREADKVRHEAWAEDHRPGQG